MDTIVYSDWKLFFVHTNIVTTNRKFVIYTILYYTQNIRFNFYKGLKKIDQTYNIISYLLIIFYENTKIK